jgi:Transposase DDE domain group 1
VWQMDERLGFGDLVERHVVDSRREICRLSLADLLRESVYSRLAGYEDLTDAARLSQDPTFQHIGAQIIWEFGAAVTCRSLSVDTALLTRPDNRAGVGEPYRQFIASEVRLWVSGVAYNLGTNAGDWCFRGRSLTDR